MTIDSNLKMYNNENKLPEKYLLKLRLFYKDNII